MSCRWESSQRPLFVKSVWLDGYRHAILTKEDPAAKTNNRSPRLSAKCEKIERPKSKNNEMLSIPAVQLLLANVRKIKQEQKTTPINKEKLQKSLTFDVIMREDVKISSKNVLEIDKNIYSSFTCEKVLERFDQNSNSLTERVMLWLDLAGKHINENKVRKESLKRICTAQVNETKYEKCTKLQSTIDVKCEIVEENTCTEVCVKDFLHEKDDYRVANIENVQNLNKKEKVKLKSVKRQVHIFIPNIAKKINENSSLISDNSMLSFDSKLV